MEERRFLRPLEIGGFFDEVFYLFRNNFWLFTEIAAVIYVPIVVLASVFGKETGFIISILFQPFVVAAGSYAISKRYLGEPCTVREAYAVVFKRFFRFIWTALSVYLITFAATLALVVPAFIVYFWYIFVYQVFVIEGLDCKNARARSKQLAQGHWWRIFVIYLLFGIILGIASQILLLPVSLLSSGVVHSIGSSTGWLIMGLYTGIVTSLIMVLQLIVSVELYYDIRVRKEGFDLELLAKELQGERSDLLMFS